MFSSSSSKNCCAWYILFFNLSIEKQQCTSLLSIEQEEIYTKNNAIGRGLYFVNLISILQISQKQTQIIDLSNKHNEHVFSMFRSKNHFENCSLFFLLLLFFFPTFMVFEYTHHHQKKKNKAVLEPVSRLLSRSHTFAIIVILDLKIHQSMWIHWSFFPKTWTKGHWPLDDLWPHVCWGHMCDSTQGSLCPSPMTIHQCMWIQWSILQNTTYIHVLHTYTYYIHTTYIQNEWSHSLLLNSVQARQKIKLHVNLVAKMQCELLETYFQVFFFFFFFFFLFVCLFGLVQKKI